MDRENSLAQSDSVMRSVGLADMVISGIDTALEVMPTKLGSSLYLVLALSRNIIVHYTVMLFTLFWFLGVGFVQLEAPYERID